MSNKGIRTKANSQVETDSHTGSTNSQFSDPTQKKKEKKKRKLLLFIDEK